MTTETQQALAVLFRRFNEEPVPRDDLVKAMSLELDWTKPSLAENLLDRGVNAGHVQATEQGLTAGFDVTETDVPFGFSPSEELFEPVETGAQVGDDGPEASPAEATPLLEALLDRIADASDGDRNEAVAAANARQDAMAGLVTIETAALLVGYARGLDVQEEAQQVLASLRSDR